MQAILITDTYFETDSGGNAVAIFEAGKHYPVTEASQRQVALGNCEVVDVPDDAEKAQAAAEAADEAAAEKATAKATTARRQADAVAEVTTNP
jgi:hypothetical protein